MLSMKIETTDINLTPVLAAAMKGVLPADSEGAPVLNHRQIELLKESVLGIIYRALPEILTQVNGIQNAGIDKEINAFKIPDTLEGL